MGAYGNATPLLKPIFPTPDLTWPKRPPLWPNCHGCIQSCYTSFTKGNFFNYRFDLTKKTPPHQNFMGAVCHITPVLNDILDLCRFDLTYLTPPPKFHRCILSHYTCVKWYFRSMQIWLDIFDPPLKFHRCNLLCDTCVKWYFRSMQIWLDIFATPPTKISQVQFVTLHLC